MASHWRIRHKLILGLALVVAIMALLLAGILKGLGSYSNTRKSIESKLAELQEAMTLKERVKELSIPPENPADDPPIFRRKLTEAEQALSDYKAQLQDTLTRHRDPNKGRQERWLIDGLENTFHRLRDAIVQHDQAQVENGSRCLIEHEDIRTPVMTLIQAADDLEREIYEDMYRCSTVAKTAYRNTMIVVIFTSLLGIGTMVFLARFFYRGVFHPIRDLELGVGRVAEGDFEHRIELHTGDEMEDLATAFNDMTSRLREIYRDLAHQVNERSRQLVRSERLASVGFLAAGVAHEINNPLASIAFCSEALESRVAELLPQLGSSGETITKYLRMIQQEAFRCKSITGRLLEFSRSGEKRRESTDLTELIQGVLDVVQHLQNCKGKQILFEPDRRMCAWINGQEIKSVVLNLVVNALDSMEEGGTLTITLGQRDGMAEMTFADTGCGMSPEILENIFEPFFTRSRTGKGTGLGLSISHRVITQHGGEIEATSPGPGAGSTFTVRLPLRAAEFVKEESLGHAAA